MFRIARTGHSRYPEVVHAIERAKEKVWPGLPLVPLMDAYASDGLFFRQAGIPTCGISGTVWDIDDIRAHGQDERVEVKDFYDGLEFQYQLIKAVAGEQTDPQRSRRSQ